MNCAGFTPSTLWCDLSGRSLSCSGWYTWWSLVTHWYTILETIRKRYISTWSDSTQCSPAGSFQAFIWTRHLITTVTWLVSCSKSFTTYYYCWSSESTGTDATSGLSCMKQYSLLSSQHCYQIPFKTLTLLHKEGAQFVCCVETDLEPICACTAHQ